jgi:protein involved in polysaccharide export with SLBB domain
MRLPAAAMAGLAVLGLGAGFALGQDLTTQKPVPIGGNDIRSLPSRTSLPPPFGANLFSPQAAVTLQRQANASAARAGGSPLQVAGPGAQGRGGSLYSAWPSAQGGMPQTAAGAAGAGGMGTRGGQDGDTGGTGGIGTGGDTGGGGMAASNPSMSSTFSSPSSQPIPATGVQPYAGGSMVDPNYVLQPGDVTLIHLYGAVTLDQVSPVDGNGDIFIPTVGPVHVAGTTVANLQGTVQAAVRAVYTRGVATYATVAAAQPIEVFVTGAVIAPGQYALPPQKSVIAFLQIAGGVDPDRGSYRDIKIVRKGKEVASVDLYDFLLTGRLPSASLHNGDTIVVGQQGPTVIASGDARAPFRFELKPPYLGAQLIALARPYPDASNIALLGVRDGTPRSIYMKLQALAAFALRDSDVVGFTPDVPSDVMTVQVDGRILGPTTLVVKREATLMDVLSYLPVDRYFADIDSVYIRRVSVAQAQKQSIQDSVDRLQRQIVTQPVIAAEQAQMRAAESEVLFRFADQLKNAQPEGRVVVSRGGQVADVRLEDGDVIVVPSRTDLVVVSGEVGVPQSLVYTKGASATQYIASAGGFTDRGDRSRLLVLRASGEAVTGHDPPILPGDRIVVFPSPDNWTLPVIKDITEILYEVAVGAGVVATLHP